MPNDRSKSRRLKSLRLVAIVFGTTALLYTLVGFLLVPPIVKGVLEKKLPQVLKRQVRIEKIRLNPFALSATVEGLAIAQKKGSGDFVSFNRFHVNLACLSLVKQALIIQSVSLNGLTFDFSRVDNTSFSFSDLLPAPGEEKPRQEEKKSGDFLFSINNIEITEGKILYHDMPRGIGHRVEELELAIPWISNFPTHIESHVLPKFSAFVDGRPISLSGQTKPFADSQATELELKLNGLNLPEYLTYVSNPTKLRLKSARLALDTKLSYRLESDKTPRLFLSGSATLTEVDVTDESGRSCLRLPFATVFWKNSNLLSKKIRLAGVLVDSPKLELIRLANGEIQPLALLSSLGGEAPEAPAQASDSKENATEPVRVTIDHFRLDNGSLTFIDQALTTPTTTRIGNLNLAANDLSTIPGTTAETAIFLTLNQTGRISGNGSLTLEPLLLKTTLDIQSLQLRDFQPYIAEQAKINLSDGAFALKGNLSVKTTAEATPEISFSGKTSIAGLATSDTVIGDDLLKWKDLQFNGIEFSSRSSELGIAEIRLMDIYANVLVNKDGTTNLASLAKTPQPGYEETAAPAEQPAKQPVDQPAGKISEEPSQAASPIKMTIGQIVIHNGQLQFWDRSLKPYYGANLEQLNGTIKGLSSNPESLAVVNLAALLDKQAPLTISGKVNPLSPEAFADIEVQFKDFNLSLLSPYTGKYAGYETDKGKLQFDLQYKIRGNQLESSNKLLLDQFTFGRHVDSPDATNLPVKLALALLKDRKGEISLDLPVTGDLDDPKFSVGKVVLQVLVNLISKAATSPFSLLGSLIPEGVDLQYIQFEPGGANLTAMALEQLAIVSKVLTERPGLEMDICARVDRKLDSRELAQMRLKQLVEQERLRNGVNANNGVIGEAEYAGYLKLAYQQALLNAPTPSTPEAVPTLPASESVTVPMMEEFILSGIKIGDSALRGLAVERANNVLGYLVESGKIEPGRLFVIEPQLGEPTEPKEPKSQALVELRIK
jgi:uncharacterized protein involved in outer membrane biogenesis